MCSYMSVSHLIYMSLLPLSIVYVCLYMGSVLLDICALIFLISFFSCFYVIQTLMFRMGRTEINKSILWKNGDTTWAFYRTWPLLSRLSVWGCVERRRFSPAREDAARHDGTRCLIEACSSRSCRECLLIPIRLGNHHQPLPKPGESSLWLLWH